MGKKFNKKTQIISICVFYSHGRGGRGDALRKVAGGKFLAKAGSGLSTVRTTSGEPWFDFFHT